jgi:hypothetical protein
MEKRVRKSKQCGQKQREERERAGNGISYIKMRSTVLSVEENKTRASAAATAPHRTANSRNHTKQTKQTPARSAESLPKNQRRLHKNQRRHHNKSARCDSANHYSLPWKSAHFAAVWASESASAHGKKQGKSELAEGEAVGGKKTSVQSWSIGLER